MSSKLNYFMSYSQFPQNYYSDTCGLNLYYQPFPTGKIKYVSNNFCFVNIIPSLFSKIKS